MISLSSSSSSSLSLSISLSLYIYIYICIYIYISLSIYMYICKMQSAHSAAPPGAPEPRGLRDGEEEGSGHQPGDGDRKSGFIQQQQQHHHRRHHHHHRATTTTTTTTTTQRGVVYRSFCLNSSTFVVSEIASRRWWYIESLFPGEDNRERQLQGRGSLARCVANIQ